LRDLITQVMVTEESATLLKNDDKLLPLKSDDLTGAGS
jgi:hypothetical protein